MGGRGSSGGGGGGMGWETERSLKIHLSNGLSPQQAAQRMSGSGVTLTQARAVQRSMRANANTTYRATDEQLH